MPPGYRTLDGTDFNDIWYGGNTPGIMQAFDMYRSVDLPVLRALAMPHPEQIMKYGVSEKNGFQRLGPSQRPDRKNVIMATMYPTVEKWGYGVGTDRDTLLRSTGKEVMIDFNRPFKEDMEHVLLLMLKAMMTDPGGANAGYGFFNGAFSSEEKITAPPKYQNNTFAASHSHYYRSGAASIALTDISAVKQIIRHHGHSGDLIGFINSVEKQKLEDLAAWTGSIIRSPVSDDVAIRGFGDIFELLGVMWHVTELVPAGYMLVVEALQDEAGRPLIMFEPANLQGLNIFPGSDANYPLIEAYAERWVGFKVWKRGAGASVQLATAGAYTNPTFNI